MKLRLFFDIDGVLLDFDRAFICFLNERYGFRLAEDHQAPCPDFTHLFPRGQAQRYWDDFLHSPAVAAIPPMVNTTQFNGLLEAAPVHLLTNFPGALFAKRKANLAAAGLRYTSLHYCGHLAYQGHTPPSKGSVVRELLEKGESGVFIDDNPINCEDVAGQGVAVESWLMHRASNADYAHPEVSRVQNWEMLHQRLRATLAAKGGPWAGEAL